MLIKANINESPSFHFNNLNTNNIKWKKKKVENLVYKLQEEKYPKNNLFINKINNTFIYLGELETETNKYYICPSTNFFKLPNQTKDEHLICITTSIQLNLIKEYNILFLDGTLLSCPISFYQIFNIIGHLKVKKISLPILSVLYKTEISYLNLFENLKL